MYVLHEGRLVNLAEGRIYGREIATHVDSSGYRQVYLPGKPVRTIQAHRFIWEAAHGPIPPSMEINHVNGDKADNRLENLELSTRRENVQHAYRTGLASNRGTRHPGRKLNNIRVYAIRALADIGHTGSEIAAMAGISRRQASSIAQRTAWRHLPERPTRIEDF